MSHGPHVCGGNGVCQNGIGLRTKSFGLTRWFVHSPTASATALDRPDGGSCSRHCPAGAGRKLTSARGGHELTGKQVIYH